MCLMELINKLSAVSIVSNRNYTNLGIKNKIMQLFTCTLESDECL